MRGGEAHQNDSNFFFNITGYEFGPYEFDRVKEMEVALLSSSKRGLSGEIESKNDADPFCSMMSGGSYTKKFSLVLESERIRLSLKMIE